MREPVNTPESYRDEVIFIESVEFMGCTVEETVIYERLAIRRGLFVRFNNILVNTVSLPFNRHCVKSYINYVEDQIASLKSHKNIRLEEWK